MDLEYEIRWHKEYLEKLHKQRKNPALFHRERTSHNITDRHLEHFKEHVIEAIPFHNSIIEEHEKKLSAIHNLIPVRKYRKLVRISIKYHGVPEYFVYEKSTKKFFFVAEHVDDTRKKWIKKTKNIAETIILEK
jgi:hypothetical protein